MRLFPSFSLRWKMCAGVRGGQVPARDKSPRILFVGRRVNFFSFFFFFPLFLFLYIKGEEGEENTPRGVLSSSLLPFLPHLPDRRAAGSQTPSPARFCALPRTVALGPRRYVLRSPVLRIGGKTFLFVLPRLVGRKEARRFPSAAGGSRCRGSEALRTHPGEMPGGCGEDREDGRGVLGGGLRAPQNPRCLWPFSVPEHPRRERRLSPRGDRG